MLMAGALVAGAVLEAEELLEVVMLVEEATETASEVAAAETGGSSER